MKDWLRRWLGLDVPDTMFLIRTTKLMPDDVLVISCEADLNLDACTRIREKVEATFPGRRCLVMSGGLKLGILSPSEDDHPEPERKGWP